MIRVFTLVGAALGSCVVSILILGAVPATSERLQTSFCAFVHDRYVTRGPDGRMYATWHPPSVHIAGLYTCHFGHEHGDDPATSVVNSRPPAFDYVNRLAGRSEAHVGFKVFVVNDDGRGGRFRIVIHQGSSTDNAFIENRHEILVDYVNDDGRELHAMLLGHFGPSGSFKSGCGDTNPVQLAAAANQIEEGERIIPDERCFAEGRIPYEVWGASNSIRAPDGRELARFKPYFTILNPNRFYNPWSDSGVLGRSDNQAKSGRSPMGTGSLYKGTRREVVENVFRINNLNGPTKVWTDVDGNVKPAPCPTCIEQFICSGFVSKHEPAIIFRTKEDYDDGSVRIPN